MVHSDKTCRAAGEQKRIQSGTLQQESKIKYIIKKILPYVVVKIAFGHLISIALQTYSTVQNVSHGLTIF
jgi:hypothetical protein